MDGGKSRAEMADIIQKFIRFGEEYPQFITMLDDDLARIAQKAMPELTARDVRMFVLRAFRGERKNFGLIMAEQAVAYYYRLETYRKGEQARELMAEAIRSIAFLGESHANAREKLVEFLNYGEPRLLVAVLENLPRNSDIENFKKVCEYLLHPDFEVRRKAISYAEECTRDAAFRKMKVTYRIGDGEDDVMEGNYRIGKGEEDFLRKTLVPLEATYTKLKDRGDADNTRKRLAILVALIYNEILDATDWKKMYGEPVEDGIYYALEEHLQKDIAPEALPLMSKMLRTTKLEEGVEKCVLTTIGRMGNSEKHRGKVIPLLMDYAGMNRPDTLLEVARMALDAHRGGKRFSSIPAPIAARSSPVARRSLAPPKLTR